MNQSASLSDIAENLILSDEFTEQYNDIQNDAFIELMYSNVLERQADLAGKQYWLSELDSGADKAAVMIGFTESDESLLLFG